MTRSELTWQSKLVLLVVVPAAATDVALKTEWWAHQQAAVAVWTLGLSFVLCLITWQTRAATPAASMTGAFITASLIYSTLHFPYKPWSTALVPVLLVSLLAFISTRVGREKKERLKTAEKHDGRSAAQVAANLGVAALVASEFAQSWISDRQWFSHLPSELAPLFIAALAALAEAAADTVSSELGQIFGGTPRMLTTLRSANPGTDGAVTWTGSLAGIAAAAMVAGGGAAALHGGWIMFGIATAGAVFGLFFDSLLGATLENAGMLNNDAVNFLSTASAAGFALLISALYR